MPIFAQSYMSVTGNVVDITATLEEPDRIFIQPGGFIEVPERPLEVRKGVFAITVGSLDKDDPSLTSVGRTQFHCLPIMVDVFRVGDATPIASAMTPSGSVEVDTGPVAIATRPLTGNPLSETTLEVDAGTVDETQPYTRSRWTVRLTNSTDRVAWVGYRFRYIRDSSLVTGAAIPLATLNNAFALVLKALAPAASARDGTLTIQISPEIAEYTDSLASGGSIVHDLSLGPIDIAGELVSLAAAVVSGHDVLLEVDQQWAKRDAGYRASLTTADSEDTREFIRRLISSNDKWRDRWHDTILGNDVAVRLNIALTDIDFTLRQLWIEDVTLAQIVEASTRLYLIFKRHGAWSPAHFGLGHALVFTGARNTGLAAALDFLNAAPDISQKIADYANGLIPTIHRYFAEVLLRMVHNQYEKRYIDAWIEGGTVFVRFCDDPADPGALPRVEPAGEGGTGAGTESGGGGISSRVTGHVGRGSGSGTAEPVDVPPDPVGLVPGWFKLGSIRSVQRLDQVETIVVVMMENRSFDHMLGRLSRKWPDKGYICYPDDATNSVHGQSPLKMVPARDVQFNKTYFAISVDPYHGTEHVLAQINGGRMDGFSRDIMTKPDPIDRRPQVPMTYYDEADHPFFYYLAENYMVCDMWFAAHPGGTYPNRWATLSGTMPELKNFPPDDRRMGYIKTPTIFDFLTNPDPQLNVEWVYYESNLGMLRMYDRYRLDDQRVLPYDAPGVGFKARAEAGTLPPVVFIEPRITGIPPLAQASDDHPPANILRGMDFLGDVYQTLRFSPHWRRSMLIITYDEHGGFYDHVPPPGTPLGDPAWVGGFPKLHPQGETFLGVRVPTFIVSTFVKAGSVSHVIFDHTSILKTILVRHRGKLRHNTFGVFGGRVPMMNQLGAALNQWIAVDGQPPPPASPPRTGDNFGDVPAPRLTMSSLSADMLADVDEVPYRFSLARAMMPKRS